MKYTLSTGEITVRNLGQVFIRQMMQRKFWWCHGNHSWAVLLTKTDQKLSCSSHLQMSRASLLFWFFEPDLKVVKNKIQKVYSSHYQSGSLFILTDEIVFAWNWLLRMSRKEWSVVIMGWYVWWLWDAFKYCAGWQRSGQRGSKQWGLEEGTFLWRRKGNGKGGARQKGHWGTKKEQKDKKKRGED